MELPYAQPGNPLTDAANLTPSTSCRPRMYCNRTATGLIHTGTQWTKRHRQIIENRIDKRNFRMH